MRSNPLPIFLLIATALFFTQATVAADWSNSLSGEFRYFDDEPAFTNQAENNIALAFRSEFDHKFNSGKTFSVEFFVRGDENDSERSHADIAELYWTIPSDNWEVLVGINKVFWGITESAHLVDIINQTDQIESFDGEDKLGQAMLLVNTFHDWGNLDVYILPGFRERTFSGEEGRLRTPMVIQTDLTEYESSDKASHIDYAIRWSHTLGIWDLGMSYFDGTSRSPDFQLIGSSIAPFYPLITQAGIDLQATTESWLWKLEAINRQADLSSDYIQAVAGLEYTFVGVNDSDTDVGIVAEYLYDDRGKQQNDNAFEDDILLASRIALNDVQSTEILMGVIADLNNSSYSFSLEASRRLGNYWKLEIESRLFNHIEETDILNFLRQDSFLALELTYYLH